MKKILEVLEKENRKFLQTHASIIILERPDVYKIKKEVNFGFLDFSTREKRLYYSILEIQLNQRLCNGLYQSIVAIYIKQNSIYFEPVLSSEEILNIKENKIQNIIENLLKNFDSNIEFGIKMNYIEEEFFLKNQNIDFYKLEKIANHLIKFYDSIEIYNKSFIKEAIEENILQVQKFIGETIDLNTFRLIKKFNQFYLKKYANILQARIKNNWIRNCHGDLHLEHIIYKKDSICIYDCIEFNEQFRYIDVANDIAFFCMDLEFYGYYRESYYFIKLFYKKYYDYFLIFLQDFYRSYRAYVRGKVYSLKSISDTISKEEKKESIFLAKRYFSLSLQYALKDIHPTVFIFMGRIGSGKSTYANSFSSLFGVNVFSSDIIRKKLFAISPYEKTPENLKPIMYSKFITFIVYQKMIQDSIQSALRNGIAVLDATFATRSLRNLAIFKYFEENIKVIFIEIQVKKEIVIERLKNRVFENQPSDAGVEEFLNFYENYQPPFEIPENQKIVIKINKDYSKEKVFNYILKKILIHRFLYKHYY